LDPTTTVDGSHQSYRLSEPSRLLPADPTRNPSSFWGDAWRGLSTHGLDPGHAGRGPTTSGLILRRLGAGGSKSGPLKSERPHSFRCHGRPSVNPLRSELTPPFFSPPPPSGWFRLSGGRGKASVLIPRPDGRPTWFVHASAASRIGSRTDPSHCTPRRQIGAGGARDWLHLFGPGDHQAHRWPGRASAPIISPAEPPELSPPSRSSC